MPYRVYKLPNGKYRVVGPKGVIAKSTTKKKAAALIRLRYAIENRKKG